MSGLILGDNARELSLPDASTGRGLWTIDFDPPLVDYENTYSESASSDGRRRIRSRPLNAEGTGVIGIGADTEEDFWDHYDEFQEMVASVHRNKGFLRYEPLRNGEPVTFDIESIRITELPQKGAELNQLVQSGAKFAFECLPYGRLDPVTWFTNVPLAGPIAAVALDGIPGHVAAWAELTLTDASGVDWGHVEVAIQPDYEPGAPDPLSLTLASGLTVSGYAGSSTTRAGSNATNVARATVTSTPVTVCATSAQPHVGPWKVRPRIYPTTADVRVRLAWKVGDGPVDRSLPWVDAPAAADWFDLDVGTIDIGELETGHSWTGYIESYSTSGTPTVDVDTVFMVPA